MYDIESHLFDYLSLTHPITHLLYHTFDAIFIHIYLLARVGVMYGWSFRFINTLWESYIVCWIRFLSPINIVRDLEITFNLLIFVSTDDWFWIVPGFNLRRAPTQEHGFTCLKLFKQLKSKDFTFLYDFLHIKCFIFTYIYFFQRFLCNVM